MKHPRLRAVVLASAFGLLAARASAQDVTGAEERADEPGVRADAERPVVLFLVPDLDDAVEDELRDALLAQFALIEAGLAFDRAPDSGGSLGERMADAQRRAAERSAMAVFWVEEQADGRWFVHMMDSARERIVVRPADAAGDRRSAAIEAVAVMVRESTRALLDGAPIAEPEPVPPPESGPPAAEPPPARPASAAPAPRPRPLRLAAGYLGTDFARDVTWRHGVAVGVGWYGFRPIYAGASYVFTPPLSVEADVRFEVQRFPAALHAGYRQRWGRAALDIELGLLIEVQRGSPLETEPGSMVDPHQPETKFLSALGPRIRGELAPAPELALFAALGLDVLLNNFGYVAEWIGEPGSPPRMLLRADDVRPVLELGVAFYP